MKFALIYLLIINSFSNFCFSAEKSPFKTTSQKLKEDNISEKDLCQAACEATFSNCYYDKKEPAMKCAAKALVCKNKCK